MRYVLHMYLLRQYDFCIPLDFLDTKDLIKTKKGQKKFEDQTQSPKPEILLSDMDHMG